MSKEAKIEVYNSKLLSRTKELRESKKISRIEMADLLGVTQYAYQKYETRTPLPHYLIEKFCIIAGISVQFFITGKSKT